MPTHTKIKRRDKSRRQPCWRIMDRASYLEPCQPGVERGHDCAALNQVGGQCTIAATDVQQGLARNGIEHFKKEPPLDRIGDLTEPLRSPSRIPFSQFSCRM